VPLANLIALGGVKPLTCAGMAFAGLVSAQKGNKARVSIQSSAHEVKGTEVHPQNWAVT
jgi:hypothetical protein